uniref:Uncharacterized protein n=1 Tax=Myoviridae sp. ctiBE32 TaxID=2826685 RepID=A0A8S5N8C6_9CAUD|nr:MAG TPA: hypothetical protein [Myoviridae sp. ctiBE32]
MISCQLFVSTLPLKRCFFRYNRSISATIRALKTPVNSSFS